MTSEEEQKIEKKISNIQKKGKSLISNVQHPHQADIFEIRNAKYVTRDIFKSQFKSSKTKVGGFFDVDRVYVKKTIDFSKQKIKGKHEKNLLKLKLYIAEMVQNANSGHPGAAMSLCPLLYVLYHHMLPFDELKDVLVLSNGHTCPVLYLFLRLTGKLRPEHIQSFRKLKLPLDPDLKKEVYDIERRVYQKMLNNHVEDTATSAAESNSVTGEITNCYYPKYPNSAQSFTNLMDKSGYKRFVADKKFYTIYDKKLGHSVNYDLKKNIIQNEGFNYFKEHGFLRVTEVQLGACGKYLNSSQNYTILDPHGPKTIKLNQNKSPNSKFNSQHYLENEADSDSLAEKKKGTDPVMSDVTNSFTQENQNPEIKHCESPIETDQSLGRIQADLESKNNAVCCSQKHFLNDKKLNRTKQSQNEIKADNHLEKSTVFLQDLNIKGSLSKRSIFSSGVFSSTGTGDKSCKKSSTLSVNGDPGFSYQDNKNIDIVSKNFDLISFNNDKDENDYKEDLQDSLKNTDTGYKVYECSDDKDFYPVFGNNITPGHPEYIKNVIDATTGPLGQGIANAVGHAIVAKKTAGSFQKVVHCVFGDGCYQEGITQEALSLASHLKLNNMIFYYDCNNITIDGSVRLSMSDNQRKRFESLNFDVHTVNGNDLEILNQKISEKTFKVRFPNYKEHLLPKKYEKIYSEVILKEDTLKISDMCYKLTLNGAKILSFGDKIFAHLHVFKKGKYNKCLNQIIQENEIGYEKYSPNHLNSSETYLSSRELMRKIHNREINESEEVSDFEDAISERNYHDYVHGFDSVAENAARIRYVKSILDPAYIDTLMSVYSMKDLYFFALIIDISHKHFSKVVGRGFVMRKLRGGKIQIVSRLGTYAFSKNNLCVKNDKPTVIILKTSIADGTILQGNSKTHGSPLGSEVINAFRREHDIVEEGEDLLQTSVEIFKDVRSQQIKTMKRFLLHLFNSEVLENDTDLLLRIASDKLAAFWSSKYVKTQKCNEPLYKRLTMFCYDFFDPNKKQFSKECLQSHFGRYLCLSCNILWDHIKTHSKHGIKSKNINSSDTLVCKDQSISISQSKDPQPLKQQTLSEIFSNKNPEYKIIKKLLKLHKQQNAKKQSPKHETDSVIKNNENQERVVLCWMCDKDESLKGKAVNTVFHYCIECETENIIINSLRIVRSYKHNHEKNRSYIIGNHVHEKNFKDLKSEYLKLNDRTESTRKHMQEALSMAAKYIPQLIIGSADLTPSCLTQSESTRDIVSLSKKQKPKLEQTIKYFNKRCTSSENNIDSVGDVHDRANLKKLDRKCFDDLYLEDHVVNFNNNYIHYGIREHAMFSVANGIAYSGLFIPVTSTFLNFVTYGWHGIRLSAISSLKSIFVLTHDSVFLGEDGSTHQPIETIPLLRATPNLKTLRPCNGVETRMCLLYALQRNGPTAILLSRQKIQNVGKTTFGIGLKPYVIFQNKDSDDSEITILSTGSEVPTCIEASKLMSQNVKVVSVIDFSQLSTFKKNLKNFVVSVEASSTFGWEKYSHFQLGIVSFGESGTQKDISEYFGITPQSIASKIAQKFSWWRSKGSPRLFFC